MKNVLPQKSGEDDVSDEILELKKALNTAKHDLQLEKVRNRRFEKSVGKHKRRLERDHQTKSIYNRHQTTIEITVS